MLLFGFLTGRILPFPFLILIPVKHFLADVEGWERWLWTIPG